MVAEAPTYSRTMTLDALPDCPPGLLAALREREPVVERLSDHRPRFHVRLRTAEGPLFAWYSHHPDDNDALSHELAVRGAIGTHGVLRSPPVLAHGDNWRLERMVTPEPLAGHSTIGLVVEAWRHLAQLDLPRRRPTGRAASRPAMLRRRGRLLLSPLPTSDVLRAKRLGQRSTLPTVTSHGDFHLAHVLPHDQAVWVIDWELSGRAPFGSDLMQLWASLPDAEDRGILLDAALGLITPAERGELHRLRYVALVRRISSKLTELQRFGSRDPEDARVLLELLPEARAAAAT